MTPIALPASTPSMAFPWTMPAAPPSTMPAMMKNPPALELRLAIAIHWQSLFCGSSEKLG